MTTTITDQYGRQYTIPADLDLAGAIPARVNCTSVGNLVLDAAGNLIYLPAALDGNRCPFELALHDGADTRARYVGFGPENLPANPSPAARRLLEK